MISERIGSINIELDDRLAYKWQKKHHMYFRGYVFYKEKKCGFEKLLSLISDIKTTDEISDLLNELDGIFSLIFIVRTGEVVACVDRVRSMPLLIDKSDHGITIRDTVSRELIINKTIRDDILSGFRHALFVDSDYTLFDSVYQVGAGKYALLKDNTYRLIAYFRYEYNDNTVSEPNRAYELLYESFNQMIDRTIKILDGRKAVIPLSGGHDSRLLIHLLREHGYNNVITYSYGMKGNMESGLSKKVSDYYGVKSLFVEYTPKPMQKLYARYGSDFYVYSSTGTSVPHVQEWYALYNLKERGLIDDDAIIVPGFTGDFFAGDHLSRDARTKHKWTFGELIGHIRMRYYTEFDYRYQRNLDELEALISETVLFHSIEKRDYTSRELNEIVERYDWYNRQSKFIVNAVRVYDYWDNKWLLPMFEKNQFDVWGRIDNDLRYERAVFFGMEKKYYSKKLLEIPFYTGKKGGRIKEEINTLIKGLQYIHYMYGYYDIPQKDWIDGWLYSRLLGVNIYAKYAMLDFFKNIQDGRM